MCSQQTAFYLKTKQNKTKQKTNVNKQKKQKTKKLNDAILYNFNDYFLTCW